MRLIKSEEMTLVSGGGVDNWYGEVLPWAEKLGLPPSQSAFIPPENTTQYCATAECAAGLLPTRSENRSQAQIDSSLCQTVVQIAATPVLAVGNLLAGLGLKGLAAGTGAKAALAEAICP